MGRERGETGGCPADRSSPNRISYTYIYTHSDVHSFAHPHLRSHRQSMERKATRILFEVYNLAVTQLTPPREMRREQMREMKGEEEDGMEHWVEGEPRR